MSGGAGAMAVFDDGSGGGPALYAGGGSIAGGVVVNHVAKWDGSSWSSLGGGMNNAVHALAVFDDGSGGGPALYAGGGYCWSVDIRRPGYFSKVPVDTITREWGLAYAGCSLDINGRQVVPDPPRPTPALDHAVDDLKAARDARRPGTRKRRRIRDVLHQLRNLRKDLRS